MAAITFFTNPMSRGQIARWALHEAGADYETVLVTWTDKPKALLEANPMGKVPTIVHHHGSHDHVVTEAPAICHYLAEIYPDAGLLPAAEEKADYFRWLFFAAGPVEQAVTARHLGFEPTDPQQQGMLGFGSYDRAIATLEKHLSGSDFVCGSRFTMADVYVGSMVDWGLEFGTFPNRRAFESYVGRCRARAAYAAAKAIDNRLISEQAK